MWADVIEPKSPTLKISGSEKQGMWESFDAMHKVYTHHFVESEGMGMSRIATFDEPQYRMLEIEGDIYAVKGLHLIGLRGDKPKVYKASWLSMLRKHLDKYESRETDEFEKTALSRLRSGEELVWRQNHKDKVRLVSTQPIVETEADTDANPKNQAKSDSPAAAPKKDNTKSYTLVGALRAGKSCVECHDARPNELLGAFVYTMESNEQLKKRHSGIAQMHEALKKLREQKQEQTPKTQAEQQQNKNQVLKLFSNSKFSK